MYAPVSIFTYTHILTGAYGAETQNKGSEIAF